MPDHEPAVPSDGGLVRVQLDLGYDGAGFSGWARQRGLRTVQQVLEESLARVLRLDARPELTVAGRTDAGVHARGQVAHVDVPRAAWAAVPGRSDRTPAAGLVVRLAGVLPRDVRVRSAREAPPGFDARFSALWRRYAYRVADTPWGVDPLRRGEVLWTDRPLDVAALAAASRALVGDHDFAAFCRRREGATTVRTLRELTWSRGPDGVVVARVVADAFCHSMVRSLVGALLPVGHGRRPAGWPAAVLAARVRDPAVHVAAAQGLTLEEVGYPVEEELAERARAARSRRSLPGAGAR